MNGRKSRKILIVEDEWLVRMELADAFEALGFEVIESGSAEQASRLIDGMVDLDLLVTDIRLAGTRTGWDLAGEVHAALPAMPVIYLSANPPEAQRMVEGSVFIEKPAMMARVTGVALELLGETR